MVRARGAGRIPLIGLSVLAAVLAGCTRTSPARHHRSIEHQHPSTDVRTFEFSGPDIGDSWSRYDSGTYAAIDSRKPSLAYQDNGILHVTTSGPTGSGLCLCANGAKPTQPYGRWDVKVRVSAGASDHGFAILLWPNAEDWPEGGEIDLAEFPDADRSRLQTSLHYGRDNHQLHRFTAGDFTRWHVVSVDWEPRSVSYFLDGALIMRVTDPREIPRRPMHLSLQAGVDPGVDHPSDTMSSMNIDWIKFYQRHVPR